MNFNAQKMMANKESPINAVLKAFIAAYNFINIGIVTKVINENYVNVRLYHKSATGKNIVIKSVRLLHIGTTKCKLSITPAVGENVLLLCPKDFIEKLEYNHEADINEIYYSAYGDINMCGLLIREEADDNVKTTISVDQSGNVSITTEGNVNINSEKNVNINGDADPFVKWTELNNKLNTFINALNNHTHSNGNEGSPTGVPITPMSLDISDSKTSNIFTASSSS